MSGYWGGGAQAWGSYHFQQKEREREERKACLIFYAVTDIPDGWNRKSEYDFFFPTYQQLLFLH